MTSLATLGEEVKIWEVPTFQQQEQFNPFDASVTDFTWSHDGCAIASCCSTDRRVFLRDTKSAVSTNSHSFQLPSECVAFDFNSDSRYLLCGCVNGSVHVYDLKSKSVSKSFTNQKGTITSVRWNWNDKYIATGTSKGEIVLHNTVTNQGSSPLVAHATQGISQLKYNPYKKAVLVAASDDGAVNFWDTNTRRLLHGFRDSHHASAKDIVFSPVTDMLMATVGLDKRLVLYDMHSKSPIKTIQADHPLTCLDVLYDGATIAVGTTRGQVFLYDMRQSVKPVFQLSAHRTSLKRLCFTRKGDGLNELSESKANSSQSFRRQLPLSPMDVQLSENSAFHSPRKLNSHNDIDVLSPVAQGNKSNNSISNYSWNDKSGAETAGFDKLIGLENVKRSSLDFFSPLRDNSMSFNSTGGGSILHHLEGDLSKSKIGVSAENSHNKSSFHHKALSPRKKEENGSIHFSPSASHRTSSYKQSPPRLGALSSIHHTPAAAGLNPEHHTPQDARPTELFTNTIYSTTPATAGHQIGSRYDRVENRLENETSPRNHAASSVSSANVQQLLTSPRTGDAAPSLPSQVPPVTSSTPAAASNGGGIGASLRDFLQDQLQEHQTSLKAEIREMLVGAGLSQNALPTNQTTSHGSNKTTSHTEVDFPHHLAHNYVTKAELSELKESMYNQHNYLKSLLFAVHSEVVDIKLCLQDMESKLENACVNPGLLAEIERLRAENERLKKTF